MSFSRAFIPVAATVLVAMITIIISLGMTDRALKKSARQHSLSSVESNISNIRNFQATMLLDYTEWGETFTNLTLKNNRKWFHYSIGGANLLKKKILGLAFIKNDGTLIEQQTRNNNKAYSISQKTFEKDFSYIRHRILSNPDREAMPLSFFKIINGTPTLFSFSAITYPDPKAYPDFPMDRRDFLLFWTVLTPDILHQVEKKLQLKNIAITAESSPDNYALKDSKNNVISWLKWSLPKKEANPLIFSLYTSLAMFALLLLGGYFSYRRIFDLIRELEAARKHAETGHRIKSEYLATMSHELRTPLNSIIGFSEILIMSPKENMTEKQEEYISYIQSSGKHLLSLINEILDMSKIEAGKYELREEEMDLKQTLDQAVVYLEKDAGDKNITLIKKIPDSLNDFMGDSRVIKQLVLNLLSNAVKFTPEKGQITIGCSVTKNGGMEIYIDDNGIGISPEKINLITEPYLQDQDYKTRSHQGTGLGLAISKAFTEMHQGTMAITSELNVGTRITLTFPASRVLARRQRYN
ncbi:MAG: HAMP domain-containing histidine kinase [Alphaproteobacteria bacterium]|nr:HAMP domain-containing histidine kinase [Alphaproteobacteria bacterium]